MSALSVAIDVTPLVGHRSGIGHVTAAIVDGLVAHDEVDLTGLLISARGAAAVATTHPDLPVERTVLPARAGRWLWSRGPGPLRSFGGCGSWSTGLDVVHGVNFVLPPHRAAAGLVTIHDLTAWRQPELVDEVSRDLPALVARALAAGAHVHTPSAHVGAEVVERIGVSADRVHVVHNGVTPQPRGSAERGRALAGGRPYVLSVGTIEPRKGLPVLVEALRSLPSDVVAVLAGAPGWGSEALDTAIETHAMRDRVVLTGAVDDGTRADLLAGAELLVYPSLDEGFGLPSLEAMDAGVPVVTTTAGALPEIVGDAALLAAPDDAEALASAILSGMDDAERQRLIDAGTERVERFRWPDRIAEFVQLYRGLR